MIFNPKKSSYYWIFADFGYVILTILSNERCWLWLVYFFSASKLNFTRIYVYSLFRGKNLFGRLKLLIHEATVDTSGAFAWFLLNMVNVNLYVIYININEEALCGGSTASTRDATKRVPTLNTASARWNLQNQPSNEG